MEAEGEDLRAEAARTAEKLENARALIREVSHVPEHAGDAVTEQTRRQRQREVEILSAKHDRLAKGLKTCPTQEQPAMPTGLLPDEARTLVAISVGIADGFALCVKNIQRHLSGSLMSALRSEAARPRDAGARRTGVKGS